METRALRLRVSEKSGEVSALLQRPRGAHALLLLAHGAGAGMRHPFLESMAASLGQRGLATLRYQFPYMEQGRRSPSPRAELLATVRSALARARQLSDGLPLLAGGKSMGGRMTSLTAAEAPPEQVRGLLFLGFPLHAAGRPGRERAAHLAEIELPMLFVQGDRDKLAAPELLRPVLSGLGERAELTVVEGGDHSFAVPKRSGRSSKQVLDEVADAIYHWSLRVTED